MAIKGNFRDGFQIHRSTPVHDGQGGWTDVFAEVSGESPVQTVLGRLSPLSSAEQDRAGQDKGVALYRFSTPATTDVQPGDRLIDGSRTLNIDTVQRTSRGNRIECMCEEVDP